MLILGQRGSGKTVLLLEFADLARKSGFIVASPTIVSKEMPARILEKLQTAGVKELPGARAQFVGGSLSAFGFVGGIDLKLEERTLPTGRRGPASAGTHAGSSGLCEEYGDLPVSVYYKTCCGLGCGRFLNIDCQR